MFICFCYNLYVWSILLLSQSEIKVIFFHAGHLHLDLLHLCRHSWSFWTHWWDFSCGNWVFAIIKTKDLLAQCIVRRGLVHVLLCCDVTKCAESAEMCFRFKGVLWYILGNFIIQLSVRLRQFVITIFCFAF